MPWASLGQVAVTRDWQTFPNPSAGGETFRYSSTISGAVYGYALIAAEGIEPGYQSVRRVWPVNNFVILEIPIPPELRSAGLIVRYFKIKFSMRSQYMKELSSWTVSLQEFTP